MIILNPDTSLRHKRKGVMVTLNTGQLGGGGISKCLRSSRGTAKSWAIAENNTNNMGTHLPTKEERLEGM
jgi:hypothetical protein